MNRGSSIAAAIYLQIATKREWRDPDSNRGHHDFQSCALPTELSRRKMIGEDSTAPGSRNQASGRGLGPAGLVSYRGLASVGEAVEFEGGLEHLLGERADDCLGLLAGLEERDGRDA